MLLDSNIKHGSEPYAALLDRLDNKVQYINIYIYIYRKMDIWGKLAIYKGRITF